MHQDAENHFPYSAEQLVTTAVKVFDKQNKPRIANILRQSRSHIEWSSHDNWNGGIDLYDLHLDVPVEVFADIEPSLSKTQDVIAEKVRRIVGEGGNQYISRVVISPIMSDDVASLDEQVPIDGVDQVWPPGQLRLFVSHVSADKKFASTLKLRLSEYGVSAFVAHENIEPTKEWQNEIVKALRSMEAMVALLVSGFHESNWTDQEIGFALARNVLIVPVRLGLDPYGFIGKIQGLAGDPKSPEDVASKLVDTLLKRESTAARMRESLVVALEQADSFAISNAVGKKIGVAGVFSAQQLDRMQAACKNNDQVRCSYEVEHVRGIIRRQRGLSPTADDDDLPL